MAFPSGLQFLLKNQLTTLWGFPCCFSLAASNIFTLALVYVSLINRSLGIIPPWYNLPGTLCLSWFEWLFPSHVVGKLSAIIPSSIFSSPSLLLLSTLMTQIFVLNVGPVASETVLPFILFPLPVPQEWFQHSIFQLTLISFSANYCAIDSFSYIFHSSYSIFHLCSLNFLC